MNTSPNTTAATKPSSKILQFNVERAPRAIAPNATGSKRLELHPHLSTLAPSEEIEAAIAERGDRLEHFFGWIRGHAWSMVSDWYEAFAVGRKSTLQRGLDLDVCQRNLERQDLPAEVRQWASQAIAHQEWALYFWDRCAQIYSEEMHEAERLAAEARERIARRIEKEFGAKANGIPQALRESTPQEWASSFDWN